MKKYSSMKEWTKDRDSLLKTTGQAGNQFNWFVKDSVRFFLGEGNKAIQVINGLILIAHQSKGMNTARLINYLDNLVPHNREKAKQKDQSMLHQYTTKKEQSVYMTLDEADEWMMKNKDWFKFGKEIEPESYNLARSLTAPIRLAVKNGKTIDDVYSEVNRIFLAETEKKQASRKAAASR